MISKDWKMKNDEKDIRQQPIQQLAMIWNYNAHVEHQHNYYGGKPERAREVFVPVDLQFFDPVLFGTEEGQKGLTALVKEAAGLIDVNSGSSWFGLYAAYRYYKKQLGTKREYVKFFTDIEALTPGLLKHIDTSQRGDKRYHNYTQTLSLEASSWYMDDGCLPPLNELSTFRNRFTGTNEQFKNVMLTIKEIHRKFLRLDAELKNVSE